MALTFLVEDGTGLAAATSYISIADAADYLSVDVVAETAWDALSTEEQEEFLMWSTRLLDQKCWYEGNPVDTTTPQGLRWPRCWVYDRDGTLLSSTAVPGQIEAAVVELAKHLIAGNDLTTGSDIDNLKKIVVDVIEIEYQDDAGQTTIPNIINAILEGIGTFRIGNASHAKILKA